MKALPLACWSLTASAVVLASLLAVGLSDRTTPNTAQAEMVIAREGFTILTAETRDGEESLFVLDNSSGTLIVYRLNVGKEQLEPAGALPLDAIFGGPDGSRGR